MTLPTPSSLPRTLLALLIASCFGPAAAAPSTPVVVNGQATFLQNGNVFSITNTPGTVINWQGFSIDAGEITRFIQQSGDSAVLNRIVGHDPSKIMGALQSNGHVFLINPNGILFGRDSRVDVNGLTASTLALSDADFLAGKNNFRAGARAGDIVNQGNISTAAGGKVFLIASNVDNSGIITTPQGQVVLAAGHTVQLADAANPALHVVVAAPEHQSVNLGQVIAQGGKVGIYGALVRQRGVVNADSAQLGEGGKIVLRASGDAMLEAGSVTSALGADRGGRISVEGTRVGVTGDARVDASGVQGGGTVLLGGGYQGRDPSMSNAQHTLFGKNASIRADALGAGDGGKVVLWGNATARALGRISARGGALSGNGGLIETSGKHLDVNGLVVNAGAAKGKNGTWLLDPYDINVVATGFATLTDVDEFADHGSMAYLSASMLSGVPPGTSLVLQATHNITFSEPVNATLGSTGSLTVEAGNNIHINAPINTGGGALSLHANHAMYASGNGSVVIGTPGKVDTAGGKLTLSGSNVMLFGPVNTGGGDFALHGGNKASFEASVDTGNGHLSASGFDIVFGGIGGQVNSGSGNLQFDATGGIFSLGPNWNLKSSAIVMIFSDTVGLDGMIGRAQADGPVVAFSPFTRSRDIHIASFGTSALTLDPARLAAFDAAQLFIGSPEHSGTISVFNEYSNGLARNLTLETSGHIVINKPITMGTGNDSSLGLNIQGTNTSSSITTAADTISAQTIPGGRLAADHIFMNANNMSLGASITGTGTLGGAVKLGPHTPTARVAIGGGAADAADWLGLSDTELRMVSSRFLGIGGSKMQGGDLMVTQAGMDFSNSLAPGSMLFLGSGTGNMTIHGPLVVPGALHLEGNHLRAAHGGTVKADSLHISSFFAIGENETPFHTEVHFLTAVNEKIGGLGPINLANTGSLRLGSVRQEGKDNSGSIMVANTGDMTLVDIDPGTQMPTSVMTSGMGMITLKTKSPLTILGDVTSQDGNIFLEAGNGGALRIGSGVNINSGLGNIGLTGGSLTNEGAVFTAGGNIHVAAPSVAGAGTYAAPLGVITGLPTVPPSVASCLANPTVPNCAEVLRAALDRCIADPTGPDCAAVLPTPEQCAANPARPGCSVVTPPPTTPPTPTTPPVQAEPGSELELVQMNQVDLLIKTSSEAILDDSLSSDWPDKRLGEGEIAKDDKKPQGEKREIQVKTYCN